MNTYIYLVRHAQSVYSPDEMGRGLSEKGLSDVRRATDIIKGEDIDVVMSSPYKRAIQTVGGIAEHIGVPILLEEGFKERIIGSEPAKNFDDIMNKLWSDETFSFSGGESNKDAQKRGITTLDYVLSSYSGKRVVIGTHGNIMVLIMNHYSRQYNYGFWKQLSMPDIYKLTFNDKNFIGAKRIYE